jgi:hypothetical protein
MRVRCGCGANASLLAVPTVAVCEWEGGLFAQICRRYEPYMGPRCVNFSLDPCSCEMGKHPRRNKKQSHGASLTFGDAFWFNAPWVPEHIKAAALRPGPNVPKPPEFEDWLAAWNLTEGLNHAVAAEATAAASRRRRRAIPAAQTSPAPASTQQLLRYVPQKRNNTDGGTCSVADCKSRWPEVMSGTWGSTHNIQYYTGEIKVPASSLARGVTAIHCAQRKCLSSAFFNDLHSFVHHHVNVVHAWAVTGPPEPSSLPGGSSSSSSSSSTPASFASSSSSSVHVARSIDDDPNSAADAKRSPSLDTDGKGGTATSPEPDMPHVSTISAPDMRLASGKRRRSAPSTQTLASNGRSPCGNWYKKVVWSPESGRPTAYYHCELCPSDTHKVFERLADIERHTKNFFHKERSCLYCPVAYKRSQDWSHHVKQCRNRPADAEAGSNDTPAADPPAPGSPATLPATQHVSPPPRPSKPKLAAPTTVLPLITQRSCDFITPDGYVWVPHRCPFSVSENSNDVCVVRRNGFEHVFVHDYPLPCRVRLQRYACLVHGPIRKGLKSQRKVAPAVFSALDARGNNSYNCCPPKYSLLVC